MGDFILTAINVRNLMPMSQIKHSVIIKTKQSQFFWLLWEAICTFCISLHFMRGHMYILHFFAFHERPYIHSAFLCISWEAIYTFCISLHFMRGHMYILHFFAFHERPYVHSAFLCISWEAICTFCISLHFMRGHAHSTFTANVL